MDNFYTRENFGYFLIIVFLIIFLGWGFYVYLDYQNTKKLNENIVKKQNYIENNLKESLNSIEIITSIEPKNTNWLMANLYDSKKNNYGTLTELQNEDNFNEQKLFELLDLENEPKLLDKLMKDLLIKNNSTATLEDTCANNILEEECKKSLFIGCAEALYLRFAIVNECTQFSKEDYLKYFKTKYLNSRMMSNPSYKRKSVLVSVGEVIPSGFNLTPLELKNTINSSEFNNDFAKVDFDDLMNKPNLVSDMEIKTKDKSISEPTDDLNINNLLSSLAGVKVKYTGWVQGWGTIFATLGGKPESGFKMRKITAFGFNPYNPKICLISLPYKTVDKFFGTQLDYCVKNKLFACIQREKEKVKGKPIEIFMIKNGKSGIFPLGDLGPAEWTGNALDLNLCAAKILDATGKDLIRFRVAR